MCSGFGIAALEKVPAGYKFQPYEEKEEPVEELGDRSEDGAAFHTRCLTYTPD